MRNVYKLLYFFLLYSHCTKSVTATTSEEIEEAKSRKNQFGNNNKKLQMNFYLYGPDGEVENLEAIVNLQSVRSIEKRSPQVRQRHSGTFNPSKPTVFVTHGHGGSMSDLSIKIIKEAYKESRKGEYNVIAVEWRKYAGLFYPLSVMHVKEVGAGVAKMVDKLISLGSDPDSISLIGHSLGAHVMGSAGKQTARRVGRVVGLDPAGPLFRSLAVNFRIGKGDAKLVEIIHTCGSLFGLQEPVGNVDFYPNGGLFQPGCENKSPKCDHFRSYYLYAEAVRHPKSLIGVRCTSYGGFLKNDCEKNRTLSIGFGSNELVAEGNYYLRTNKVQPLGIGLKGIKP